MERAETRRAPAATLRARRRQPAARSRAAPGRSRRANAARRGAAPGTRPLIPIRVLRDVRACARPGLRAARTSAASPTRRRAAASSPRRDDIAGQAIAQSDGVQIGDAIDEPPRVLAPRVARDRLLARG